MPQDSSRYARALLHRDRWHELGFGSRRLVAPEFRRVYPGWWTPSAAPATLNAMCHVLQRRILPGTVISHATAAVLLGIPIPWQHEQGVGLLAPPLHDRHPGDLIPSRPPPRERHGRPTREEGDGWRSPEDLARTTDPPLPRVHVKIASDADPRTRAPSGVVLHRRLSGPSLAWNGLAVSTPGEAIRELAEELPLWDVVAAVDMLIGPKSLVRGIRLADLEAVVASSGGRCGVARMRTALSLARPGVESPGETYARLLVRSMGFPEPTPNLPVRAGGRQRRVDNGWARWRVGLEFDGAWRRLSAHQWRADEQRRDDLAAVGWELRRHTALDAAEPLPFLLKVRATLGARGATVPTEDEIRSRLHRLLATPPAMHLQGRGWASARGG